MASRQPGLQTFSVTPDSAAGHCRESTSKCGTFARQFSLIYARKGTIMQKAGLPKLAFVLLAVGAAIYFSSLYAQLPEVMASHFNARGAANGWQTKSAFFNVLIAVSVLAAVVGFGIPRLITLLPPELINLPNKGYWLAPERRAGTMDFLNGYFAWFGCALFAVILITINFAVQANFHPERRPDATPMWYLFAGFLAFAILGTVRIFKRFGRSPDRSSSTLP
jgi:uncharacterized membrane protein